MPQPFKYSITSPQTFLSLMSEDNIKAKSIFYQSINNLYLLLSSLKHHFQSEIQTEEELMWREALLKIRDEVVAKLVIECLVNYPGPRDKVTFQVYLKYIESFLPNNPEIVCSRMVNIIHEAIYYLSS